MQMQNHQMQLLKELEAFEHSHLYVESFEHLEITLFCFWILDVATQTFALGLEL